MSGSRLKTNFKKKIIRSMPTIAMLLRVGLGIMFLVGSIPKIRQPYDFLGSVYKFEIVGPNLGLLVASVLPWLELFLGICLISGVFISGSLLITIGLSMMFGVLISSTVIRGLDISCDCFGPSQDKVSYVTIARSGSIILTAIIAWILHLKFIFTISE
ncbi:MAG TPA: MauE/DoxX family redox-associated membrane protein [Sedimentisphaerales bacterium]|nr:MauE/DoxX family redox-associated membrane protein [Sedimentisphaerales bacterium]